MCSGGFEHTEDHPDAELTYKNQKVIGKDKEYLTVQTEDYADEKNKSPSNELEMADIARLPARTHLVCAALGVCTARASSHMQVWKLYI